MADFVSTIIAALIGSVIGSVGAVLTDHWLTGRSEKIHRREIIVQRYLYQLQEALETLYYRLYNITFRGMQGVVSPEYFKITTLYALGRVLAIERIFALEAVYPQLDSIYSQGRWHLLSLRIKNGIQRLIVSLRMGNGRLDKNANSGLGKYLKEQRLDLQFQHTKFNQYDRFALAEALIVHEGDLFRPSTYLEFRKRYEAEDSPEKQWLEPASKAIQSLSKEQKEKLLVALKIKATEIAEKTGIDSSISISGIISYKIGKGDTLQSLAQKFNISTQTIKWANNLESDNLTPGQTLKILPVSIQRVEQ